MIGGRTPREELIHCQETVARIYKSLDAVEGNERNVSVLRIALIDVMTSLDTAVNRAGRV